MRHRARSIITSTLGVAATAGLIAGVPLAIAPHDTPVAATSGVARVDAQTAALTRLDRLEQQADAAGVAAQKANEALLQHRSATTEAAAAQAEDALKSVARQQDPQLTALARVLGPETVADGGEEQVDADSVISSKSRAAKAVRFARSQKGKPYRFAGSGMGAYDCSGLTMRSYSKAGKGIGGHSATRQYNTAKKNHRLVSYGKKRVGDLIFYGRPGSVYHVAIYSGHGKMIEAPYPGKRVREVKVRNGGRLSVVGRPA
ncbi:C40 family peptidase [Amnibacterium endophyticum]|uniref:C40 family peptidase n=1 Tax=Amnibacterium endophyticum TaxID=2109337 RepID=A0ABW4LDJ7_9MICO